MEISVRISKKEDRGDILALAWAQSSIIHLGKKRQRLEKAIGTPELLVAEADGSFAGFMYVYFKMAGAYETPGGDELHISALCIDTKYTEHGFDNGIASALIEKVIGTTEKPITADVPNGAFNLISIYTNKGFDIIGHTPEKVTLQYGGR